MSEPTVVDIQELYAPAELLKRIGQRSLYFGIAGAIALVIGVIVDREQFFRAYLLAYMFWMGLSLGCLALLMVQYLTGGNWGVVIRRLCDAAVWNIFPYMVVLFVPMIWGVGHLYPWANPAVRAADESIRNKAWWLSDGWFFFRAGLYLIAWSVMAYTTRKWSLSQDAAGFTVYQQRRFQAVSGAGLVLYTFTITFAAVDWMMSLNPHWKSTIYGFIIIAGEVLLALSFCVALLTLLVKYPPMSRFMRHDIFQDLGKLMLTFVMLWAYFQFSQWLIIWAGNLPEEIDWYKDRLGGGWQWMGLALIVFHFAVPFAMLLSREIKRQPQRLMKIAALLIVMRYVDLYWYIIPNFQNPTYPGLPYGFHFSWLYIAAPVAIGGFWLWFFFARLAERPVLPIHDPILRRLVE